MHLPRDVKITHLVLLLPQILRLHLMLYKITPEMRTPPLMRYSKGHCICMHISYICHCDFKMAQHQKQ